MSAVLVAPTLEFGERFLAIPDLFPARLSGEVWGDEEVQVDFPGGPYLIQGLTTLQKAALEARFGSFASPAGSGGATPFAAVAYRAPSTDFLDFDLTSTDYTFELDFTRGGVRLAGPSWMALYVLAPRPGGGFWIPEELPGLFTMVVENFLRVFAAYRAFETGGAMFHSSCAVKDGRAHLFFGRSGAGKTTISRLCERAGLEVLSDDMNVVSRREADGVLLVERLPFAGELCSRKTAAEQPRRSYPLGAVYRLQKGSPDSRAAIARSTIASQMYVCSTFLNADPLRRDAILTRVDDLLAEIPSFSLTFGKDSPVTDLLFGGTP